MRKILVTMGTLLGVAIAAAPTSAKAPENLLDTVNQMIASHRLYSPAPKILPSGEYQDTRSGCCSHHGGVAGCDSSTGHQACNDGSDSPTCGCE